MTTFFPSLSGREPGAMNIKRVPLSDDDDDEPARPAERNIDFTTKTTTRRQRTDESEWDIGFTTTSRRDTTYDHNTGLPRTEVYSEVKKCFFLLREPKMAKMFLVSHKLKTSRRAGILISSKNVAWHLRILFFL